MTGILLSQILLLLCGVACAATVAVTLRQVHLAPRGGKALAAYRAAAAPATDTPPRHQVGSGPGQTDLRQVPLRRRCRWQRSVVLMVAGMPLAPALGGGALAYILADEFLKGKTRKARLAIEQELPTFVSRLGGMLLVTRLAPPGRGGDRRRPCIEGQPLRIWMERLLAGWPAQGEPFLAQAHLEANASRRCWA